MNGFVILGQDRWTIYKLVDKVVILRQRLHCTGYIGKGYVGQLWNRNNIYVYVNIYIYMKCANGEGMNRKRPTS